MNEGEKKKNVPEEFDGHLECNGLVLCCTFNRLGTLIAAGCNDGKVIIWDFLTRCEVREIQAHAITVTSVGWSRDGRWLVTTSIDNSLAVWDVCPNAKDPSELLIRWPLKVPIMRAQFHPRNKEFILVCPYKHAPILLQLKQVMDCDQSNQPKGFVIGGYRIISSTDKDVDTDSNVVASFDRKGEHIYTGNARGWLTIYKTPTNLPDSGSECNFPHFEVISSFKVQQIGAAAVAIRDIEFAPKDKRFFLVNSTDRSIRLYQCDIAKKAGLNGTCMEDHKFQELVDKPLWKRCCFSGERKVTYVCGGSAKQHALYIWDIETGAVKKMFQPPSKGEVLMDVQWHPTKPVVVSVSNGLIFIWARAEVENWSAYAPTFKELDENQEYEERESEFDIEDEDANLKLSSKNDDESDDNISIDIETIKYENGDGEADNSDTSSEGSSDVLDLIPLPFADVERMNLGHN